MCKTFVCGERYKRYVPDIGPPVLKTTLTAPVNFSNIEENNYLNSKLNEQKWYSN